jgi:hypothetical protein
MNPSLTIGTEKAKSHCVGHRSKRRHPVDDMARILLVACIALAWILPLRAVEPATVTFSLDFPGSEPERYSITVQSDGSARYECSAKISEESEDRETYQAEFKFSDATRARIFDLAAQAHYFSGKIDSGNRKLANTGAKKLAYKDSQRESTAAYNFSPQPAVQQLTALFQNVSATLEYGRHLTRDHQYQKLALDDELKRMEDQARRGEIAELQAVKPVLQAIYDDNSVMNVVRARAQRIMEMSPEPPAGH